MNRENSKSKAARLKIMESHFSNRINVMLSLLTWMVLPHAVSWVAKECTPGNGNVRSKEISLLYLLVRSIPALFDIDCRNNKRKRET
mmetsp:Transcript_8864/g.19896  ORF Transcript_8864/g.19896 Transcript_8864/m.19896 type:complete len:87 (+) Transcript_8864:77-337(+)